LREFRDRDVLATFAGSQFMTVFNQFYYSFSPSVAQSIAENDILRAVMKLLLYPLIGMLHLAAMTYDAFPFSAELGVLVSGLVASGLIGLVYFSPLVFCSLAMLKRYRGLALNKGYFKIIATIWLGSLGFVTVSEIFTSPTLMMASTAAFVLLTAVFSALTATRALLRLRHDLN